MTRTRITLLATPILIYFLCLIPVSYQAHCTYGPRGSLTAICVNATSATFRMTDYKFDHLDETLICVNCSLNIVEQGTLDISGNHIINLDLSNSSISIIEEKAFLGLIFMEKLNLSNNPIQTIYTGAFTGIRKVKYLDMTNTVNKLPENVFRDLHLLETLILENCKLTKIEPGVFSGLHNLRSLDLSSNNIYSLSGAFEELVNLRILNLENNLLTTLEGGEFSKLRSLLLLNLNVNLLENFAIEMPPENSLRILSLSKNFLGNNTKTGIFKNLHNLERLDLSQNLLKSIPPKLLQGLFHLRILNLNENQIKEMNTGSFSGLPHLRVLQMNSNLLQEIKITGSLSLHSLHSLNLANNHIKQFDYIGLLARMPRLSSIDLTNNDLDCNIFSKLSTILTDDNIEFTINTRECKETQEPASKVREELVQEYEEPFVKNTLIWWLFFLVAVIIILLGVLFYVQFVILYRMGNRPIDVNAIRNLGAFRRS